VRPGGKRGRSRWLLARRSLTSPGEISYYAWHAHVTLSMLALAWLSAVRAQAAKGEPAPATRA
jgi:hypothetical protein